MYGSSMPNTLSIARLQPYYRDPRGSIQPLCLKPTELRLTRLLQEAVTAYNSATQSAYPTSVR